MPKKVEKRPGKKIHFNKKMIPIKKNKYIFLKETFD